MLAGIRRPLSGEQVTAYLDGGGRYLGAARWLLSSLICIVVSGLTAWLLTPGDVVIIGASGLIFGWLTYLLARGIWSRRAGQVIVAVLVLLVYGGLIFGVLPGQPGVSWQAHLGGAVAGVLAAWLLHRRRTSRQLVGSASSSGW